MRKSLCSNYEVCHVFATQSQDEGYCNGTISFNRNVIKSYAAPIAVILDPVKRIALITTHKYSVTTSVHTDMIMNALSHYDCIYAYDIDLFDKKYKASNKRIHESNIIIMINGLKEVIRKQARARTSNYSIAYMLQLNNLHKYVKYFRIASLLTKEQRKIYNSTIITPAMTADELKHVAKQREKEKDILVTNILEFHSNMRAYIHSAKYAYLRLNDDRTRIETSKGSQVLIEHARVLWNAIQRTKRAGKEYIPTIEIKIDYYTLTRIDPNGTAHIGCHTIPYSESESIAKQLNWI